ncbi:S1 RNA-binding domain-containing protein [Paenarthrobacter ilicis]|uniref:S1 RNA-binding domain-containing protein n=1 Tax=Paenarthrobacter ilicis TaxID=43665 RepID=UPI00386BE008
MVSGGRRAESGETHRPGVPRVAWNDIGTDIDLLEAVDATFRNYKKGELVCGVVVHVDREGVLLDMGCKSEAFVNVRELALSHSKRAKTALSLGDLMEVVILVQEDEDGRLIASKIRADAERAWPLLRKLQEDHMPVSGQVIGVVGGGLVVDVGVRAFLPSSHLGSSTDMDLPAYIGKRIDAKILELDPARKSVVLSRRGFSEEPGFQNQHTLLSRLEKGQTYKGIISSVAGFGAFVDLGGVKGLIHVSELSWKHIDHPSQVVEVGQEVTVEVLDVDLNRERVSLSLKGTDEDPWPAFARTHVLGQIVRGKVAKLVPFGAFVRVEDGIEGLAHISELAVRHVELAEQVVSVGDELFVKIVDIDLERRRISLSLKQANEGVDADSTEFDPASYGMAAEYDEEGNYKYPEGFDPESNEWREGYETQRAAWNQQYADAQTRWEAHKKQVAQHAADDAAAATSHESVSGTTSYSSEPGAPEPSTGTLASNEDLLRLRLMLGGE